MSEANKKRRELSKHKECFCINCHEELDLSLEHRRGEVDIECPNCEKVFSIEEAERFLKNLSNVNEGDCPNCGTTLLFSAKDRIPEEKILCEECKQHFYLNEAENPIQKGLVESKEKKGNIKKTNKSKFFDFSGRARRKEFWFFILLFVISGVLILTMDSLFFDIHPTAPGHTYTGWGPFFTVFILILFIPHLAISTRRLHDIGMSGWWLLLGLIPFGGLILLAFFLTDSKPGTNKYGPNPKGLN